MAKSSFLLLLGLVAFAVSAMAAREISTEVWFAQLEICLENALETAPLWKRGSWADTEIFIHDFVAIGPIFEKMIPVWVFVKCLCIRPSSLSLLCP